MRGARNKDPIFTRTSYGKSRTPRSLSPRRTKAVFWGLLLLAVSTYTLISTAGLVSLRPNFLQWLVRRQGEGRKEEEAGLELPSDSTTPEEEMKGGRGWEEVQGARAGRVRRACNSLNITQQLDEYTLRHLLVDNKHKALYCYVPKVACTSWKRLWFLISGQLQKRKKKGSRWAGVVVEGIEDEFGYYEDEDDVSLIPRNVVHAPDSLPNLARYMASEESIATMLRTYKKFVFVRHPLDRLVSAYRDKLEGRDPLSTYDFHKIVLEEIKKMVRHEEGGGGVSSSSSSGGGGGENVTFTEFVEWLTPSNGTWTYAQRNEHWRPVFDLCAPCAVQYDAIGKYEHLLEEMNATLHWLGAGEHTSRFPAPDRPSLTASHKSTYLRLLSSAHRISLLRTYLLDFLLFGYAMP